jgi:tetratricopeptide (TPR) repeat protein
MLSRAVELEPNQAGFRLNLAEGLQKAQRYEQALIELQGVIARDPANARAWEKSGDIAALKNDEDGATAGWERARSLDASNVSPALKLARLAIARQNLAQALNILDVAASRTPADPDLLALRTEALVMRRDWLGLQATSAYWTRAFPGNPESWRAAARAAFELGLHAQAMDAFRHVIQLEQPSAANLTSLASLCLHALDIDAARKSLEDAEALASESAEMLSIKALILMYLGRFPEAETCCRRCLAQSPENISAHVTLGRLRRGQLSEEDQRTLQAIVERQDRPYEHRIPAAFTIAHAHDARGEVDSAFQAYERAHVLSLERDRLEGRTYDRQEVEQNGRRLMELADATKLPAAGDVESPRPIFIVGMPRSGTTLIEGVLSAHSRVFAGGERPTMRQILFAYLQLDARGVTPGAGALRDWSAAYLSDLPALGGADHITDKHPLNFEAVPLIARLFPQSIIVHVRRDPLETCLSIYRQEFNKHWAFAHRLEDIGHFYGHYARLIAHWGRRFPDRFVTIQYESFAADFKSAAPTLLKQCGLAWEPACLDFQKAPRAIATFSAVQARGPVEVANGRALRYANYLTTLRQELERANVDLETGALR